MPNAAPPESTMDDLREALDLWAKAGRTLTVWWRDDDAVAPTSALDRLLSAARHHRAPLALAVIPAGAGPDLAATLAGEPVRVLQHGFRHHNHAAPGGRAVECGGDRDTAAILAEFARGRERLDILFGGQALPVMVPPWNRIEDRVRDRLTGQGYRGVSTFGTADDGRTDGLIEVNAHLDILRWKPGAHFAGRPKLLAAMVRDLDARLAAPRDEPFGLLTHHLVHDEESWTFLDELLALLASHPAVQWADAGVLFSGERPA